jgi:hypothetical protein
MWSCTIPGITPLVTKFADDVVDAGFTVDAAAARYRSGKEPSGVTSPARARFCS